jgi:hypothetical protein
MKRKEEKKFPKNFNQIFDQLLQKVCVFRVCIRSMNEQNDGQKSENPINQSFIH